MLTSYIRLFLFKFIIGFLLVLKFSIMEIFMTSNI